MALKLRFNTVEEIPAEHRAFYVHQNGVWVLDVEGGLDTGVEPFGKNPFKRGPHWNLTEQFKILKRDPALAKRLKAAA
jgi:hypothetical protein